MTTRLELRTAVRRRLEDTGATALWDDAALNEFLAEGMRRYGLRVPKEASTTVTIAAGATSAAVTPAIEGERVVRVFDQAGGIVARARVIEPEAGALASTAAEQAWRWWGGSLLLARAASASGDWRIDYLAERSLPADDVTAVELVSGDEEIVVLLAAASALRRRAIEDGKRGLTRGVHGIADAAATMGNEAERLLDARRRRARGGWTATT